MPLNLSALIRYKTLNNCFSSIRKYTIEELVERCSDALSDYKGEPTSISERTIREDIKHMRSSLLGFNAPIVQKDGRYYYEKKNYDFMNLFIKEEGLAREIIELLSELGQENPNPKIQELIERLKQVTDTHFMMDDKRWTVSLDTMDSYSIDFNQEEITKRIRKTMEEIKETEEPAKKSSAERGRKFLGKLDYRLRRKKWKKSKVESMSKVETSEQKILQPDEVCMKEVLEVVVGE